MTSIKKYPAQVYSTNGATTGPIARAAASTFTYFLDVTMDDLVRRIGPIAPHPKRRYGDQVDSIPWEPGDPVEVWLIGTQLVMFDGELPDFGPCTTP